MESSIGDDFSRVKAYVGRRDAMDLLNARAATWGEQVVFADPSPDKKLVAHELIHVAQHRRAGGARLESRLSAPSDAAEQEADRASERAAAGERVRAPAAASSVIHRDIKDKKLDVPLGHFEIDMTKVETGGDKTGEDGTISFEPNEKAPDSKVIRLSQVVNSFDVPTAKSADWSKTAEANRNKMQTAASDKVHVTGIDETLKAIAQQHFGDPARFAEIFDANKPVLATTMKVADGDKKIPSKLQLTIRNDVSSGFYVDHLARDPKAKVRGTKGDPEVPQDFVWPGEEKKTNKHGSKAGKKIDPAMIADFPGVRDGFHWKFTFETVARSEDAGIHYGTLRWSFDADRAAKKVTQESHSVTPGVSDTFRSALDQFTKFYKNPHTVMKGETLRTIAEKYYGDRDKSGEIFKANKAKIANPDVIAPGLKLDIPIIGP